MRTVSITDFRRQFVRLIDGVSKTRKPLLVTRRGKPFVKVVPVGKNVDASLGRKMWIVGDIESPIELPESWEVLR